MPTVIDSLVIEFGLDPSKFTKGQKEAIASLRQLQDAGVGVGKNLESQGKKTERFFSDFKRQVLEIGALFLGGRGIQEFVGYISNLDASTGRLSKTLDMGVGNLSAWQGAVKQVGGTAEDANGALGGLTGAMQRLILTGDGSFLPLFNRLGISLYNSNHQLKDAGTLLLELAKAMEGVDPARAAAMLSMAPGMNQSTINLLLQGRDAVQAYLDASKAAGTTTRESAAAAAEYQKQLNLLNDSATSVGRSLFTIVAPALTSVFNGLMRLINAMRNGTIENAGARAQGTPTNYGVGYWATRAIMGPKTAEEVFGPPVYDDGKSLAKAKAREAAQIKQDDTPAPGVTVPGSKGGLTTITTTGGKKVTVSTDAAGDFLGFLNDIEGSGAPVGSLGGYNNRNIAGTNILSEHAKGRAIDMGNMTGRDQIDPALRAWINAHPDEWRAALMRYHMRSGGDFKNPDLGHVEWRGPAGAPAAALAGGTVNNTGGDTRTSSTNVEQNITIHAEGQDGAGIARSLEPVLHRGAMATHAEGGPN